MELCGKDVRWFSGYAHEVALFGAMCANKKDMVVLAAIDSERTIEDYVKLACLTKVFGFGRILGKLCDDAGDRLTEIQKDILRLKHRKQTFVRWMTEFIEDIPDKLLRTWAVESWTEETTAKTKDVIEDINRAILHVKSR